MGTASSVPSSSKQSAPSLSPRTSTAALSPAVPETVKKTDPFPRLGFSWQYVLSTIIPRLGGEEALQGMTTEEVYVKLIKPLTAAKRESAMEKERESLSLCELILFEKEMGIRQTVKEKEKEKERGCKKEIDRTSEIEREIVRHI
jgi:hypothetical protein